MLGSSSHGMTLRVFGFAACLAARLGVLGGLSGCDGLSQGESIPSVSDLAVTREPVRGVAVVAFRLWDAERHPVDVSLDYTTNSRTWRPCTLSGSTSNRDLTTSEKGPTHELLWDSQADIPGGDAKAWLRLRADNGFHEAHIESEVLFVRNSDAKPTVGLGALPAETGGDVPLSLVLADDTDDTLTLFAEVSIGNGDFYPANLIDAVSLAASPQGVSHTILWNSQADVGSDPIRNVRLRVWAEDSIGPGDAVESIRFDIRHAPALSVTLHDPPSLVRFALPVSFVLVGPTDRSASGLLEYSLDGGNAWQRATLLPLWQSPLESLRLHPGGTDHLIRWDTFADLESPVERDVLLRLSVGLVSPESDIPPVTVDSAPFDIVNSQQKTDILISEIFRGDEAGRGFFELTGQPGQSLDGFRLREVWGDGFPEPPLVPWVIYLDGYTIPDSRAFVIAGPEGPPADFPYDLFDQFFLKGLPTNFILEYNFYTGEAGMTGDGDGEEDGRVWRVTDAVGLGDFTGWSFLGEGRSAPDPGTTQSLTRQFSDCDSGDNSLDFVLADPSPGTVNPYLE